MKYDLTDLPSGYDRARDHGPAVLALWMDAIARRVDETRIARIVDLGCGTARFSGALAERFHAHVIGLDPSAKMLGVARAKEHGRDVEFVRAAAEALPLRRHAVDLVFMSMSIHHFDDRAGALRECTRVLRDGGWAVLRTGTLEQVPHYPYTPFFPAAVPVMYEVLPDLPTVRAEFAAAGFALVSEEIVRQTIAPDWNAYADKLAAGGDSVLARLTDRDMSDGIERVRAHARAAEGEPVIEPIDLLVFERPARR